MNNITLNWSAEDRARIDRLIELLEGQAAREEEYAEAAQKSLEILNATEYPPLPVHPAMFETPETPAEPPQEAAPVEYIDEDLPELNDWAEEPQAAEDEAPAPTYEMGDVLAKVQDLIKGGKKAECRAIVTEFAPSVSTIPPEKFGEVMARLTALEG